MDPSPDAPVETLLPAEEPHSRSLSMTSVVLGLCSIVVGAILVVPVIGIALGMVGLRREPYRKLARTGITLNCAMLALFGAVLVAMILFSGEASEAP
ncbi:hypothetical protein C5C18_06835 [Rathayibacter tritici]|uniref:hypothetical protein n=1 Tax=Rathayibacter tritici TaxID=33888 RepID=UPI000829FB9A|nr:hypothetical protein [Rathayibacter tritici]PPF27761.1 hypothetical protein C5C06_09070 [Rathayibacter tritici]PPF65751.1 hypothetical protein C5C21_10810 [Rathayibacter tritici]PPG07515.1 hypothetical protein C5C18_06835 [Rathayibacter tritici]PPI17332.1 hypothetical protein C5D07_04730 [Rathayibacter tritici]PPI46429.1 hypothetical protein C5D18_04895 [Rathayibacter tritici]